MRLIVPAWMPATLLLGLAFASEVCADDPHIGQVAERYQSIQRSDEPSAIATPGKILLGSSTPAIDELPRQDGSPLSPGLVRTPINQPSGQTEPYDNQLDQSPRYRGS